MNMKTIVMVTAIAALAGAATGCYWWNKPAANSSTESCAGLEGTLKSDCEARKTAPR